MNVIGRDTMHLPVPLSSTEQGERSKELAGKLEELARRIEARKEWAKQAKAEEDELEGKIRELARIVATGEERRPVEVYLSPNLQRRTIETIRQDTGEVVLSRSMTDEEWAEARQTSLRFVAEEVDAELAPAKVEGRGRKAKAASSSEG